MRGTRSEGGDLSGAINAVASFHLNREKEERERGGGLEEREGTQGYARRLVADQNAHD
jgi:hypothetical protein